MITWMDLQGIVLSEISQTEKDKYCIINYMWNLKKTNSEKQRVEWWPVGVGGGEMRRYWPRSRDFQL